MLRAGGRVEKVEPPPLRPRRRSDFSGRRLEEIFPSVIGDALCTFNPIYAQGMSAAAKQAKILQDTFYRNTPSNPDHSAGSRPRSFPKRRSSIARRGIWPLVSTCFPANSGHAAARNGRTSALLSHIGCPSGGRCRDPAPDNRGLSPSPASFSIAAGAVAQPQGDQPCAVAVGTDQ